MTCGRRRLRPGLARRRGPARPRTSSSVSTSSERAGTGRSASTRLRLTNLDKVLFPGQRGRAKALTKRDLVRHNAVLAPAMLPYLGGRPVNLHRFPDGIGARRASGTRPCRSTPPTGSTRWHYDDHGKGETEWYMVLDSPASVAWVANYGAVELHPWTSTTDAPHQPTWAMIDIDPGTRATFEDGLTLARLYRTALEHLDVRACPKVTGKRGIQIWVPVATGLRVRRTPRRGSREVSRPSARRCPTW